MDEAGAEGSNTLKRVLTATNLTTLGIGAIIGAGIFVLTGTAAAQFAGPAIVYSFILAGTGCLFAGLCYAEFASMIPIAGSAYTYGYATLGELVAWIIGWDLILEYLFGAATVAVGWSGYFTAFMRELGWNLSDRFTTAPFQLHGSYHSASTGAVINLPAIVLVVLMSTLLVIGIKESARFNNVIVFVKVAIVFLVIGFGFMFVKNANWHPFIPKNTGTFGHFGWSGVVRAAGVLFFSYIGFDAVSTAAQEAKNPQKDMPIGILGSLAICTVLYILMSLVITGLANYTELNVPHPVFVAISKAGPGLAWLGPIVNIGAILGLASVVLVMLLGQPRIFFSMARDGLLPPVMARVHPRFKTPYVGTILTGVFVAVFSAFANIAEVVDLTNIGTLFAFVLVSVGVIFLRHLEPDRPRPFRVPWVPLTPLISIVACLYLMLKLPGITWVRFVVWLVLGLVFYFSYGYTHSAQRRLVAERAEAAAATVGADKGSGPGPVA